MQKYQSSQTEASTTRGRGKKKEKSNREKKNGYAHEQWLRRKEARNSLVKQVFIEETGVFVHESAPTT